MLLDKKRSSTQPRIGELFVEAGLIKPQTVTECLLIAKRAQLPLGRVLIMSGYVSAPDVDCVVMTQQMMKAGEMTRESAQRLVRRVHCNKISIEEAQAAEIFERAFSLPFSQIGKLFLASEILSEEVLNYATQKSAKMQLTLGNLLVDEGIVSEELLSAALDICVFVRDQKMTKLEAAKVLKSTHEVGDDLTGALTINGFEHLLNSDAPRLLDLMHASTLITEADVSWVLEMSLEAGQKTGRTLLDHSYVSNGMLEAALELQQMLASGTLRFARAAELLQLCHEMNTSLESLFTELDNLNQIAEFLRRGKILDESVIRQIAAVTPDFDLCAGSTLVREGIISHAMLTRAVRCLAYFRSAALTEQQAVTIFRHSLAHNISPEESMWHINWDNNNRYGSQELLGKTA